jgi:hypothetical protein
MKRHLFVLASLALGVVPASMRAGVVLSENFDELTPAATAFSAGAFSAIGGTNIDIVGNLNGSFFPTLCVGPESGNCIDLDGSNGNPQGIFQSNTAIPAGTYYLSFDLIGSQRGNTTSTTVTFGPYNQTFTLASGDVTTGIVSNVQVTLTSPSFLTFTSNTPGNTGMLLDNVLITTTVTTPPVTTPAPATLGLTIFGCMALLGYVLWARRRLA